VSLSELPEILTVEEAAVVLRISRSSAVEQARRFRDSGGAEEIPNYRIGRTLRVPRDELARRFGLLRGPA
jgi:hypothetical protein